MPIYILMSKLSRSELGDPRGRAEAGRDWKRRVEKLCPGLRWIAHYALLGQYDFMDIYESPDDRETPIKVSLLSRERGAVTAESWPAIEYQQFLPIAEAVENAAKVDEGD